MLERQHTQLIAGVHEMFKFGQQSSNWPNSLLELARHSEGQQPLTHQILEALGVLYCSPQDEAEDPKGEWRTFEPHPQDDGLFNESSSPSPKLQNPPLRPWETIKKPANPYRSTHSQQHPSSFEGDISANMEYNPTTTTLNLLNAHSEQVPSFSINMAAYMQHQPLPDQFHEAQAYNETMGLGGNTAMAVNWNDMEDMVDINGSFLQPAKSS